jgi:hypothetical protein
MTFTLSNLYFFVCIYVVNFSPDQTDKCTLNSPKWPIAFLCTVFPLAARLLQSLKRYYDSRSMSHVINVCPLRFSLKTHYVMTVSSFCNRQGNMGVALSVIYSTSCGDTIVSPLSTANGRENLQLTTPYLQTQNTEQYLFCGACLASAIHYTPSFGCVSFSRSLNLGASADDLFVLF